MTLKHYLNIAENKFTFSNDFLFISHNYGEEYVLNLKTKEKFHNPEIKDTKKSLATIFNIPLTTNHYQEFKYKDKIVYFELVEGINQEVEIWGFLARETSLGATCYKQLKYGIQQESGGLTDTYEILRKERVDINFKTYDHSIDIPQIRIIDPMGSNTQMMHLTLAVQPTAQLEYLDLNLSINVDNWEDIES